MKTEHLPDPDVGLHRANLLRLYSYSRRPSFNDFSYRTTSLPSGFWCQPLITILNHFYDNFHTGKLHILYAAIIIGSSAGVKISTTVALFWASIFNLNRTPPKSYYSLFVKFDNLKKTCSKRCSNKSKLF